MYEAWQAQQKVQKDQERKHKTDAAVALQSYRRAGLSEEETKLAALREEERLKKADAEKQLHGYRGQMTEEEARLAALRQEELRRKQQLEEQLRGNGVVTAHDLGIHNSLKGIENSGAVEAMRAQFVGSDGLSQGASTNGTYSGTTSSAPRGSGPEDDMTNSGGVSSMDAQFQGDNGATELEGMTATARSLDFSTVPSPAPPAKAATVSFMFGVLTSNPPDAPALQIDGYLARADQIARTVIMDSPNSFLGVSLEYPIVRSIEKDHSRTDANRSMVTVSISFLAPDAATAKDFHARVVEAVRVAIADRAFTRLEW